VETISLTKSFGWEGTEVFQQQDVQELTRVLFDALEETFRGTPVENIIDELYAGELVDYIRCLDVDYQSERKDKFLDCSFAIVPFGSDKAMQSLTECIEMFLKPELLDGDNQYYAEKFEKKVDAIKGLKFGKLPPIMSVQLKRFVYDFSGNYVVQKKLNDQVKFPMVLNMNKYVATRRVKKVQESAGEGEEGSEPVVAIEEVNNDEFEEFLRLQMEKLKNDRPQPANSSSMGEEKKTSAEEESHELKGIDEEAAKTTTTTAAPDHDVVYDSLSKEEITKLVEEHGEYVYELYAVLIHSGAISGGHYYAYIKDLNSGKWYNFNDSSVTVIDEKTVQEAWGGTYKSSYPSSMSYYTPYYSSSSSSSYQSSANAYMLMYRQVTREVPNVPDEMIPTYIQEIVKKEQEKREAKIREEEEYRNKLNVKILFEGKERTIAAKRNMTYPEFLTKIWEEFKIYQVISGKASDQQQSNSNATTLDDFVSICLDETPATTPVTTTDSPVVTAPAPPSIPTPTPNYDLFRLRDYNQYTKLLQGGIDNERCKLKTLGDLNFSDYKCYYLETRTYQQEWEEYYADGFSILVEEFDSMMMFFKEPRTIRLPTLATVGELRQRLSKYVNYPANEIRIMKITAVGFHDGRLEILDREERRVREDYYVYDGMKVYFEHAPSSSSEEEGGTEKKEEEEKTTTMGSSYSPYYSYTSTTSITYKQPDSLAFEAYLTLRNRIEIRFNRPPDSNFNETLYIDSRSKIQDLRAKIAEAIGISVEKCRLFKLNTRGQELKDSDTSLSNNGVYNTLSIAVSIGNVTRAGYYPLALTMYEATDQIVGVNYLPELEPETEEVTLKVSAQEANDLYAVAAAAAAAVVDDPYSDENVHPPRPPSPVTHNNAMMMPGNNDVELDVIESQQVAQWQADEEAWKKLAAQDDPEYYEDDLSNKGNADEDEDGDNMSLTPVGAGDQEENDDEPPPLTYAEAIESSEYIVNDPDFMTDEEKVKYFGLKDIAELHAFQQEHRAVEATAAARSQAVDVSVTIDVSPEPMDVVEEEKGEVEEVKKEEEKKEIEELPSTKATTPVESSKDNENNLVNSNSNEQMKPADDVEPSDFGERTVRPFIIYPLSSFI
jgi:hypothetical protein